jgi:hypothetical protein
MVEFVRRIGRAFAEALDAMNPDRRVQVTNNLYFRLPRDKKINLVCSIGEDSETFELTIPEAGMIFESMKSALESRAREQIELSSFVWTTDCRIQADNHERIAIRFKCSIGSAQMVQQRDVLAATLVRFESRLLTAP